MQNDKSKFKIKELKAREILDSRGEPTVEVEVYTDPGVFKASVPSGASRGRYEAVEIRDGGRRFFGKGVMRAVENIKEIIAPKATGQDVSNQKRIDEILIGLAGPENKSRLGANAVLGVSVACCKAGAGAKKIPLYQHIAEIFSLNPRGSRSQQQQSSTFKLPKACFNILEGGVHAASNDLDVQEFMVIPELDLFRENLRAAVEIYYSLKKILEKKFGKEACNLGDEGGFAPPLKRTEEASDLIMETVKEANLEGKIKLGLDVAASEFFKNRKYNFEEEKISGEALSDFYLGLIKKYPILFLEDPFSQDDWQSFQTFNKKCDKISRSQDSVTKGFFVVGDDLTVTNPERIKQAKEKEACQGIILKPNQVGTVTETIEAAKLAKSFDWKIIVSHRAGETCDDFIADLAVGIEADFIKAGPPARGERVAKYNRLLRIEEEFDKGKSKIQSSNVKSNPKSK